MSDAKWTAWKNDPRSKGYLFFDPLIHLASKNSSPFAFWPSRVRWLVSCLTLFILMASSILFFNSEFRTQSDYLFGIGYFAIGALVLGTIVNSRFNKNLKAKNLPPWSDYPERK